MSDFIHLLDPDNENQPGSLVPSIHRHHEHAHIPHYEASIHKADYILRRKPKATDIQFPSFIHDDMIRLSSLSKISYNDIKKTIVECRKEIFSGPIPTNQSVYYQCRPMMAIVLSRYFTSVKWCKVYHNYRTITPKQRKSKNIIHACFNPVLEPKWLVSNYNKT
jgi:hypothetical protein